MAGAVMWFGVGMLPLLRRMPLERVQKIANEASDISVMTPLHLMGPDKQFVVPSWNDEKLSGCQVITLMVFGLWVMCGEDKEAARPLYEKWPIAEAVLLANAREAKGLD